jgi:hypothetical protein
MNQGPRCVVLMKKTEVKISRYCPFKDFAIISDTDKVEVIDSFKVEHEQQRMRAASVEERNPDLQQLTCICLDFKRDSKLEMEMM